MKISVKSMENSTAKSLFREEMRKRRDALSVRERTEKSIAAAEWLWSSEWYEKSECVLVYSAIRSEVDLGAFCARAWRDGKRLYFPRVSGADMEFYRTDSPKQLVRGHFSVMEPRGDNADSFERERRHPQAVPVLVPGVAFSKNGGRIGYGGGYYDRYLKEHPRLVPIGVCFESQLSDRTERSMEEHDIRMGEIVTELGIYRTAHGFYEPQEY